MRYVRALRERWRSIRGVIPSIPGADRSFRESIFRLTSYMFVSCRGGVCGVVPWKNLSTNRVIVVV